MKSFVVPLVVTILALTGTVAQNQTARRKVAKNEVSKPGNDTMKICQGLAIPQGYVVVGYSTSSVCPHGAYLLKKQTDYESSLPTSRNAPTNESESAQTSAIVSAALPDTSARTSKGAPARNSKATDDVPTQLSRTSVRSLDKSAQPANTSVVSQHDSGEPASVLASNSRPRRVSANQTQIEPPTLAGADEPQPLRPPTLSGTTSADSLESSSGDRKAPAAGPEEVSEGDVVRVDTTLVTVPVSVLDRQGRFVPNLRREDFSVLENGNEQSIAYFETAEKPFTVALLLDTSASTHFHLWEIKEAAIAFATQLRPQDRVLVVSFNDQVLLLTEATNDLNLVSAVIEENAKMGNATRLYDAVDLTVKERLNKIKGRKAIVLFT